MSTHEAEMMHLEIDQVHLPQSNYREEINPEELQELADSIKDVGVIQAVTVRPRKIGGFELVCGERRYRASLMVDKTTIPASIRELTDDQAFEMQIVENLQRKEVHPLDEAKAFKRMLDTGRYITAEIAAKVAKAESYILQRLKLNDLIVDIKQDFYNHELGVGHAVLIARLDDEQQLHIFNKFKNSYGVSGYGTIKRLSQEVHNHSVDLSKAQFPLDKIFDHAGGCDICPKRSKNNPMLFSDMQSTDSCFNKTCHSLKTDTHIQSMVQEIVTSGKDVLLGRHFSYEADEAVATIAKDYKIPILKSDTDYSTVKKEGAVQREVFNISGPEKGKISKVWVTAPVAKDNPTDATTKAEIERIETRAKRSLELDQEKIHARIIESLKPEIYEKAGLSFELDDDFVNTMFIYFAMQHVGLWHLKSYFIKMGIEISDREQSLDKLQAELTALTLDQKKRVLAMIMFSKTQNSMTGNSLEGQMVLKLANSNLNVPVAAIRSEQALIAATRIERTTEKLAALKGAAPAEKKQKLKTANT
jgi:ParB/RepB/Spo0J family partition protein